MPRASRPVRFLYRAFLQRPNARSITVAIAWAMQKFPYVFPIIGGRKIEHLHANIEALDIALTPEQIKFLDDIVPFDKGFPYNMFVSSVQPTTFAFTENLCRATVLTTPSFTSPLAISTNGLLLRLSARRNSR